MARISFVDTKSEPKAGQRLIEAAKEAAGIARGERMPVTKIVQTVTEKQAPVTKKRGRPPSDNATPNAERQAAFRKRRAAAKATS
jgi:hypothetical protein